MAEPLPYPATPPVDRSTLAAAGPGSMPLIWSRVAARLLDQLLVGIPLGAGLVIWLLLARPDDPLSLDAVPRAGVVLLTVVPLVYEFVALSLFGATLGKWALGLRVVTYTEGGHPRPYQAGLRVVVVSIGGLLGLGPVSGGVAQALSFVTPVMLISAVLDPIGRGLHDKAAGTIVLRSR